MVDEVCWRGDFSKRNLLQWDKYFDSDIWEKVVRRTAISFDLQWYLTWGSWVSWIQIEAYNNGVHDLKLIEYPLLLEWELMQLYGRGYIKFTKHLSKRQLQGYGGINLCLRYYLKYVLLFIYTDLKGRERCIVRDFSACRWRCTSEKRPKNLQSTQ